MSTINANKALFSAALLATIVASCGKKSDDSGNSAPPAPTTQPQNAQPAPAPAVPSSPAQSAPAASSSASAAPAPASSGPVAQPVVSQVGDFFLVNIPVGMHTVYRTSTFDQPMYLKFSMVDAGTYDSAAPFQPTCNQIASQGQNFAQLVPEIIPAGTTLNYCEMTPSINWNASANPWTNSFKFMTMNSMTYNSLAIASDNSLGAQAANSAASANLTKMYINVFTNMTQAPTSAAQAPFTNEFSQTSSRLQMACGSQSIQYLGNAATFQGYFAFSVAASPIFGCVTPRNGQWYVDVATFPMDSVTPIIPSQNAGCGWSQWASQSFTNRRGAEIVVEMGPYSTPPAPMGLAPQAQTLMIQNIKKLTP